MNTSSEESRIKHSEYSYEAYLSGEKKLIDLSPFFVGKWKSGFYSSCGKWLERLLSIEQVNERYRTYLLKHFSENNNFFDTVLGLLDCRYEISEEDLANIPREGPTILVANHPFGGIDGVILGSILSKIRPDFKFLANYLLGKIPEIAPFVIGVDPFEGEGSTKANINPLRETISILKNNGCVATFPSGEVSHFQWKSRGVLDSQWSVNIARIAKRTNATVVPVYFEGRNSILFQLLGSMSETLRTGLLVREFLNKSNLCLSVKIGSSISARRTKEFSDSQKLIDYLRLNTYLLKNKNHCFEKKPTLGIYPRVKNEKSSWLPISPPELSHDIRDEINGLGQEHIYYERGKFAVYVVKASQIPKTIRQIGYLRELTFREVGEGTGKSLDLDQFDEYYWHMFLWDRESEGIAGAYRLAEIKEVLNEYGKKGLYTHTLFKFNDHFLKRLSPGIELGRSFIVPQYQRKHATLSILWKGVGAFISRRPWCVNLFGPVSISQDYHRISRNLMVQFFKSNNGDLELQKMVHPRKALNSRRGLKAFDRKIVRESIPSVDHISALVSELETDKKGIPTLLRHYLKLNGKLISFNVDKEFSNALDGLIVVNIKATDPTLLGRVFSEKDLKTFLQYHNDDACV